MNPGVTMASPVNSSEGKVSQKMLTQSLRQMEANGLVCRTVYAEVPPRVEYSLTPLGESMRPVLDAMLAWGESYQARVRAEA